MTCSRAQTEDTQILGTTLQNLVSRATWLPGSLHPRATESRGWFLRSCSYAFRQPVLRKVCITVSGFDDGSVQRVYCKNIGNCVQKDGRLVGLQRKGEIVA